MLSCKFIRNTFAYFSEFVACIDDFIVYLEGSTLYGIGQNSSLRRFAMNPQQSNSEENPMEVFDREIESEYEKALRTRKEIELMIQQSQQDLNKLVRLSSERSTQLQVVHSQFETMPRIDIKAAYTNFLDTQQRLLVTRGQVEKLQNDVEAWSRYISLLEKVRDQVSKGFSSSGTSNGASYRAGNGSATLEMVINAQENEREALSKRMHDGPAQTLSNFMIQTEIASRFLDIDPARAKDEMNNLKNAAMSTFREVRTFIFELRPMMLDDLGPIPTIQRYVDSFKEQSGSDITLTIKGSQANKRFPKFQAAMLFRAIQELISNAYRHNQENTTKVQIAVSIGLDEHTVKVTVNDTGKGFDAEEALKGKGLGLKLIRERVELIGGTMDIDAVPGRGTKITFQVPILEDEG
jgi:two-component system sensor histidine kinase DegS